MFTKKALISLISSLLNAAGSNLRVLGLPQAAEGTPSYGPAIFQIKVLASPASVANIVVAEQSITVTGLILGDIAMSANKPTINGAIGLTGAGRIIANAWKATFVNPTAGAVVPTASEVYDLLVFRPAF